MGFTLTKISVLVQDLSLIVASSVQDTDVVAQVVVVSWGAEITF